MKTRRIPFLLTAAMLLAISGILPGCLYVESSSSSTGGMMADAKAVTNSSKSADLPMSIKGVEVENRLGFVHVTGVESSGAGWSWRLTVGAKTEALAKEAADAADCQAVMDGDKLRLVVHLPDSINNVRYQSDIEVRVPKNAGVRVSDKFGEVRIVGIDGDVAANDQSGSMDLSRLSGKVRAENAFGALKLEDSGPAVLKNRSGTIEALQVHGTLDAETSFASLIVEDVEGAVKLKDKSGRIEVRHVKGAAEMATSFAEIHAEDLEGNADFSNQSGRVEAIRVSGNASIATSFAEVRAEKIGGDLAVVNRSGKVVASGVAGNLKAQTSFAGMDLEGAGGRIEAQNQSGTIRLRALSSKLNTIIAETTFASLEVRLPEGLKPAVQAKTKFADVESDFPIISRADGQDPFEGVEAGTPRIKLRNQSGKIRITSERLAERNE